MSAVIKACNKGATIKNTASECSESMGPTAMLYAVPSTMKWTDTDLEDFTTFLLNGIHGAKGARIYPLFGPSVPIRKITLSKESDVIPVMDDGTPIFVRYGTLTRAFATTEGGLCFALALQSLNHSGYSIVEVDNANQILMRRNEDGTYGGLRCTFMYSPSPDLADFKNPGFINFQITFTPAEYVGFGVIFQGDATISDQEGLIDVSIVQDGAPTNAGSTRATATDTIVIGATGDTVDIKTGGVSLAGAPVTQTGTETTATLLAAKIAAAITTNAAVNGGYTAVNAAGVLTISAPASKGATANTTTLTATIVGAITATPGGAFAGGVTGTAVLKVAIQTSCGDDDLIALFGTKLVTAALMTVLNSAGAVVTPSLVAIVAGIAQLTIPYLADTYTVGLAVPATLLAAGIEGYEEVTPALVVVS